VCTEWSSKWYYKQNGETFGPVSLDQLRELLTTGELLPRQAVWKVGTQSLLFVHATTAAMGTEKETIGRHSAGAVHGS
jgi:hypothetical protein